MFVLLYFIFDEKMSGSSVWKLRRFLISLCRAWKSSLSKEKFCDNMKIRREEVWTRPVTTTILNYIATTSTAPEIISSIQFLLMKRVQWIERNREWEIQIKLKYILQELRIQFHSGNVIKYLNSSRSQMKSTIFSILFSSTETQLVLML